MANNQFNLQTVLTANIANLTTQLNRANSQISNFRRNSNTNNLFSGAVDSLKGLLPALSVATIAVTTFKGTINTTQAAGDSWALTMASATGALEGFYRTIGTGD